MSIRFDEKGKFFTDFVSKESVPVIVQTLTHRVKGNIHIRPGERLKDEINQGEPFFAVTEATIYDHGGKVIYRSDFLALNREHIIWIIPEDQMGGNEKVSSGGGA
jgi:hypothetical protein